MAIPSVRASRGVLHSKCFPVCITGRSATMTLLSIGCSMGPAMSGRLHHLARVNIAVLIGGASPGLDGRVVYSCLNLCSSSIVIVAATNDGVCGGVDGGASHVSTTTTCHNERVSLIGVVGATDHVEHDGALLAIVCVVSTILNVLVFTCDSIASTGAVVDNFAILLCNVISDVFALLLCLALGP